MKIFRQYCVSRISSQITKKSSTFLGVHHTQGWNHETPGQLVWWHLALSSVCLWQINVCTDGKDVFTPGIKRLWKLCYWVAPVISASSSALRSGSAEALRLPELLLVHPQGIIQLNTMQQIKQVGAFCTWVDEISGSSLKRSTCVPGGVGTAGGIKPWFDRKT